MLKDTLSTYGHVDGKVKNDIVTELLPKNMSQIWVRNISYRAVDQ